jgi:hypothetical protein
LKTYIQGIVYFKNEKHGELGEAVDINCTACICRTKTSRAFYRQMPRLVCYKHIFLSHLFYPHWWSKTYLISTVTKMYFFPTSFILIGEVKRTLPHFDLYLLFLHLFYPHCTSFRLVFITSACILSSLVKQNLPHFDWCWLLLLYTHYFPHHSLALLVGSQPEIK